MLNPLPFYIPFFTKKGTPFVYLLLTNGTPFIHLVWNFASLLTAVTVRAVFLTGVFYRNRMFSQLHKAIKFTC